MVKPFLILLCILVCTIHSNAQLPVSNVYVADFQWITENKWQFHNLMYVTADNSEGYNNQPYFLTNDILLLSARKKTENNTDILKLDIANGLKTKLFSTKDHEYSPRRHPLHSDEITCVRVPEKDSSIQELVSFSESTGTLVKTILDKHGKIGYYRHIEKDSWLCFIVEEDNLFSICQEGKSNRNTFASNIGRCFEVLSGGKILFVQKRTGLNPLLKEYDSSVGKMSVIAEMPNTEDFAIDGHGRIICANQSSLLVWDTHNKVWQELINLSSMHIKNINRLAIHNNRIAFVSIQ